MSLEHTKSFVPFGNLEIYDLFYYDEKVCAKMSHYQYYVLTKNTKYGDYQELDKKTLIEQISINNSWKTIYETRRTRRPRKRSK